MKFILLLISFLTCLQAYAQPIDAEVNYLMLFNGIEIAEVKDTLTFSKDSFKITSDAKTIGIAKLLKQKAVNRISEGNFGSDGQLMPTDYQYERDGEFRIVKIDYDAKTIETNNEGEVSSDEIADDYIHDYLTLAYNFYAIGTTNDGGMLDVPDGRRINEFLFRDTGKKNTIDTGLGPIEAVVYEREPKKDRKYQVWFAPSIRYIPVLINLENNYTNIKFVLQSVIFKDQ